MRVVFLANSNEFLDLGPGVRLRHEIMADELRAEFGEVEMILKPSWPTGAMVQALEKWVEELEPDVIYLNVAEYWCLYESIPLRLERHVPLLGRPLGRLGTRAAETPRLSHNPVFQRLHNLAKAFIAGEPQFLPQDVGDRVMDCVRVCLRREGMVVVVDGQRGRRPHATTRRGRARIEARRQYLHRRLREECARLHVAYEGDDVPQWKTHPEGTTGHRDGFHQGAAGQEWMAREAVGLIRRGLAEAGRAG